MFTLDGVDVWDVSISGPDGTVTIPVRAPEADVAALLDEMRSHSHNENIRVDYDPAVTPLSIGEFRTEFAHRFEDR